MFSHPHPAKSVDNLSLFSFGSKADASFHSNRLVAGQRSASRRGSTTSSIHSVGGTLNTTLNNGGSGVIYESGQNAISTLLQPPIVRTGFQPHSFAPASSTHKPPTARDIPPVTLTNIPKVDPEDFAPYLSQVGALYEQLRRVRETPEDDANNGRKPSRQDDPIPDHVADGYLRPGGRARNTRKDSIASLSSLSSIEGTAAASRASLAALSRKNAQGPPPLSTIPPVYLEEDFHLENPRTFDVVSERSEVIRPSDAKRKEEGNDSAVAPRKTLATNAILQEKLSWYLDIIEIHLVNSISTASTTFFTALGSLKELHSETAESVRKIKTLRKELEVLDEEIAANGLKIVEKRRREENLRQLADAVRQLKLIADEFVKCESLVDAGEVDKALTTMDALEKLISGERDESLTAEPGLRLRDLRSASALQGVKADLASLRFRSGKAYESKFSQVLLSDLRRHVDTVSTADVLSRWNNAASRARGNGKASSGLPTYLADTEALKAQLLPTMVGLHRAKHITAAAAAFREEFFREMRNIVRRPLPSGNDDDNESMISVSTASGNRQLSSQEKSSILARNLRALDPEEGEQMLVKVYVGVTEILRRLSTQVKVLLEIASSISNPPPPLPKGDKNTLRPPLTRIPTNGPRPDRQAGLQTPSAFALQEELHEALDVGNLMAQAVDVAIDRVVKVLKVRSDQAIHLAPDFFLRYFSLNLYFTYECEAISGRSGNALKAVVNGHIKDFVQWHRDSQMQKLAQGMESDQWNAKDFSNKNAELLDQILGCSTGDTEAWAENTRIWIPYQHPEEPASHPELLSPEPNGASKEKTRPAVIEMEKFVLPNSAVLCLDGIGTFLQLIAGMPSMTTEIAASLVSYLQLFNSRCTQLILGAGATRSAGLKNITTKHLALASQALSFVASLVPHMREFARRHAPSGAAGSSLMGEFDKIRRLLQEHQVNIHQKLVDIMSGRAAIHAKSVRGIDWDAPEGSNPPHGPRPYIETLVKETTTLHRVLTKHLPETHVQMIMVPVFSGYKDQLGSAIRQADVKTERGRERMLADVDFLAGKLAKIEGFGDTCQVLSGIIKAKQIAAPAAPAAERSSAERATEAEAKSSSEPSRAPSSEESS
ncbi:Vacuolar protein sorting-associated protein 54 [Escovopsis weberi]|uniref:Vacuolar protein sorting-associated protein 54 n=1 Tax=Escovopsis weberi TaxID=150374 RepID=A0A0M8MXP4_ESCWE|nr:Vacuolar protein sorting-associated protein 54 [Escovopsis weberi]